MLKSREELEQCLKKESEKLLLTKGKKYREVSDYLYEKYNVPTGTSMDMMARNFLSDFTENYLFYLADGIDNFTKKTRIVEEFFTTIEIQQYSDARIETEKFEFPIVIKCLQVTPSQWIGVTDVDFFVQLRKHQMLNYKENAQRVFQKKIKGENTFYTIFVNKKSILEIRNLLKKEEYISDDITLNIPLDEEVDFYYNEKTCEMIINDIKCFDISDGYHRLLSMFQEKDNNPDFNYPVELRIVNFSDQKARQFIFQKDQKTKMRKIDSDSMNVNRAANIVVERLNQDMSFNLKGAISRGKGQIAYQEMANIVDYLWFKGIDKQKEREIIIQVTNELRTKFNCLTENDTSFLGKNYTFKELCIILYMFRSYNEPEQIKENIDYILSRIDKLDNRKFKGKMMRAAICNEIEKFLKGDGINV